MKNLCKIRDIQRMITIYESGFEKKFSICLNEGMALCSLKDSDNLTPGELSDMLGLTSSNMSKVLSSVEKKGYVVRVVGDKDRRTMCFSLTQKGKELVSSLRCEETDMTELLKIIQE